MSKNQELGNYVIVNLVNGKFLHLDEAELRNLQESQTKKSTITVKSVTGQRYTVSGEHIVSVTMSSPEIRRRSMDYDISSAEVRDELIREHKSNQNPILPATPLGT